MAKWNIPIYNSDGELEWITVNTPLMPASLIICGAHPITSPVRQNLVTKGICKMNKSVFQELVQEAVDKRIDDDWLRRARKALAAQTLAGGQGEMKYFEEVENRDYEKEIILLANDRVLAISKNGNKVTFREKGDDYFFATFTIEEAIELLKEAIAYIERT
jgi:hypothetical protein